jgi:hypothetical protein
MMITLFFDGPGATHRRAPVRRDLARRTKRVAVGLVAAPAASQYSQQSVALRQQASYKFFSVLSLIADKHQMHR